MQNRSLTYRAALKIVIEHSDLLSLKATFVCAYSYINFMTSTSNIADSRVKNT